MAKEDAQQASSERPNPPPSVRPWVGAWQPITWRGVAAFSVARVRRLLIVQCLVALTVVGVVLWFLHAAWFPVVRKAIRGLPETGSIEHQELISPRVTAVPLAETRLLSFVVSTGTEPSPSLASDLRVELRPRAMSICGLLGCLTRPYPKDWAVEFNRPELESWWGAWEPAIYTLVGLATFVGAFASWFVLATLYAPFVRVYAFFKDRTLTLRGSWKLSAAALLPAALVAGGGVVLYGLGAIDLFRFVALYGLHFPIAWIYLVMSTRRLPAAADAVAPTHQNPFGSPATKKSSNVFSSASAESAPPDGPSVEPKRGLEAESSETPARNRIEPLHPNPEVEEKRPWN